MGVGKVVGKRGWEEWRGEGGEGRRGRWMVGWLGGLLADTCGGFRTHRLREEICTETLAYDFEFSAGGPM